MVIQPTNHGVPVVTVRTFSALEIQPERLTIPSMLVKDVAFAEKALSLPASERAGLARLVVDSLEGDPRSDEAIREDLQLRLKAI